MTTSDHPWAGRRLHLVGIGGAGMSGYARVAAQLGAAVSGTDRSESPALAALREEGIDARPGGAREHVPDGAEVFHSTAIPEADRLPGSQPRAELLRAFSALKRTIAVAGTHGKTTTSSMVAHALITCGFDPAYIIGGKLSTSGEHAAWGSGDWLVVEADESDGSMLALSREIVVVTNVELDHWESLEQVRELFRELLAGAPQAVLWDRPEVTSLRAADQPYVAFDELDAQLAVPGAHNRRNAAAALAACELAGADADQVVAALKTFAGAGRRFERVGTTAAGAQVVDDYAHHPTEVAATLAAAREAAGLDRRVVAVLQPHLFSRARKNAGAFGRALAAADLVCVLDVYPAREDAVQFPGVTGLTIAREVPKPEVLWARTFDQARTLLGERLRDGDLCVVMGAGDSSRFARSLATPVSRCGL